jgi:hypothetical protein
MSSIAVRNNNPLNLRPGQPYEGLRGQNGGFCDFVSPPWGFRAAIRNYITKADRGVKTIRALISEWAPPGDNNDTEAYIRSVSQKTGFGADEEISLKAWDVCSKVCYAQTEVETGEPFEKNFTLAQLAEGALRAGIVDAPKSPVKKIGVVLAGAASAASAAAPTVVDAINTYRPVIDQSNSALLKTAFGVAAVLFAVLTIANHVRSSK